MHFFFLFFFNLSSSLGLLTEIERNDIPIDTEHRTIFKQIFTWKTKGLFKSTVKPCATILEPKCVTEVIWAKK